MTRYGLWREEFIAALAKKLYDASTLSSQDIVSIARRAMCRANKHNRYCVMLCNDGEFSAEKLDALERKIRDEFAPLGLSADFVRDPRSCTFRLDGFPVPQREGSAQ
jgi:hypothetical protein